VEVILLLFDCLFGFGLEVAGDADCLWAIVEGVAVVYCWFAHCSWGNLATEGNGSQGSGEALVYR
jgi:hypothetical protein